ncbi:P-type cation-transporting ATPase [Lachnellula subtilissima]|uniref:P-type cation-transporting ATPase n=1 Tax=Lachnellula subtilissima TaxID=602034 RepID=A0A8H8RW14_9HELO|nr:P-type cation-transporting ATPase [Lachnellula subtilissima]
MTCSTSAEVERSRQRTCTRSACSSSSPSPDNSCCDDNCLVEIARRDCMNEHNHQNKLPSSSQSSIPLQSDEEPCESHLSKAKAAYSEMLNKIGCICKVLISLNLESCCAQETGTARRRSSEKEGLLAEMRRASSERGSVKSLRGASCAGSSCCSPPKGELVDMVTKINDCCSTPPEQTGTDVGMNMFATKARSTSGVRARPRYTKDGLDCCGEKTGFVGHQAPASDCGKVCCSEPSVEPAVTSISASSCSKGCCSESAVEPIIVAAPLDDCGKGCCSEPISTSSDRKSSLDGCCSTVVQAENHTTLGMEEANDRKIGCQDVSNPTLKRLVNKEACCSKTKSGGNQCSQHIEVFPQFSNASADQMDLEKGAPEVEHLIISVQGMTCTGCEKSLSKALTSMPAVSNIKTSLVLGRAEFDLRASFANINIAETITTIEKMTGFTCSKMSLSGHELDLIVEDARLFIGNKDLPYGISDIALLDSRTIRVIYHPEVLGARDLMRNPFFELAKLAPMADPPLITSGRAHLRFMLFKTLASTVLTIPVLVMAFAELPPREIAYGAASLVLATIVQVYIAGPWYISAFKGMFFLHLVEVDFLVVLSTSTAYIYSIIAYAFLASEKPLSTGSFFETSTLLVTLIMVGRLVTSLARQRAVESISIESLQPSTAILVDPKSDSRDEIDARLLQYGDVFVVLPDSSITTDGIVISGTSDVDESMTTGEATLVAKQPGSPVVAGSINHSGILSVRLTRLMGDNTIKAIGLMVDEAKSSKAKFQDMADRVAAYFVPIILVLTVIVFIVWVGVGKGIRNQSSTTACINAMTYAISALIVSCPCAIGLAIPMVLVIAGGVAAKNGVIFKSVETIEKARNISHVVFDKTGTLTQGLLAVERELYLTGEGTTLGPMILGLTSSSKHPVSTAIAAHLKSTVTKADELKNVTSIAGCGIEATWGEKNICAGNPYWLGVENLPAVKNILSFGVTVFCITVNKGLVAVYGLKDSLRLDTMAVINELKRRNIEVSIISGDNEESVKSVSRTLDLPESHVRFRCSPADKQIYIKEISTAKNIVMFCGDGTNDAVALAQASVGLHVSGGTDIAQSAADTVLIRPALGGVIVLIDLSKAFYRRVVFNFAWSFFYNTFAILLAAGAFPNARIPPQYAGLGEIVSVLPVIAIGVQLRWAKFTNFKV